jgi:hypothetical protein
MDVKDVLDPAIALTIPDGVGDLRLQADQALIAGREQATGVAARQRCRVNLAHTVRGEGPVSL